MDYLKIDEVAAQWGISSRRLQILCAEGKIEGATRFGRAWMIPKDATKPVDGRTKASREVKAEQLNADLPIPKKTPFLYLTNLYHTPGCAENAIAELAGNHEAQVVHTATTYDELYTLLRCGEVVTIRLDATLENIGNLWCDHSTTAVLDMNGYGISFTEGDAKLTVGTKSSLTLKGVGTITVDSSNSAIYYKSAILCRGTLFIEDDITTNGNGHAISFEWSGATNISGGTINAQGGGVNFNFYSNNDASLTITGGTFSCDPSAYVDLENYTVTQNGDGTWTVTAK